MLFCQINRVLLWQPSPIRGSSREMTTQSLPAASLRPTIRLPATRVLLRLSKHLICWALSAIGAAISGIGSRFLPGLRETLDPYSHLLQPITAAGRKLLFIRHRIRRVPEGGLAKILGYSGSCDTCRSMNIV